MRRSVTVACSLLGAIMILGIWGGHALAHTPSQDYWNWTCSGGDGVDRVSGNCGSMTSSSPPVHHSYANAQFYYTNSVSVHGWTSWLNIGYSAWDRTYGHEFDFIKTASTGAQVVVTTSTICGNASAVGCTSNGLSGRHIIESTATIKFRATATSSLRDDIAAHEFGHYLGLGHSDISYATMGGSAQSGQASLDYWDRRGRCQVYGHAHSYWGGC